MKKRTDLNYSVENAIFNFNKTKDKFTFFNELDRIQCVADTNNDLMVKLSGYTILYTFTHIKMLLSLPTDHKNYKFILGLLEPYGSQEKFTDIQVFEYIHN